VCAERMGNRAACGECEACGQNKCSRRRVRSVWAGSGHAASICTLSVSEHAVAKLHVWQQTRDHAEGYKACAQHGQAVRGAEALG